jgi:hypothetical protein
MACPFYLMTSKPSGLAYRSGSRLAAPSDTATKLPATAPSQFRMIAISCVDSLRKRGQSASGSRLPA